ncbi:MAG TPA: zinc-binding dehydrogenase [Promicromonospora sp.]|nr:zinc-binding dehydrogenase [Promicromonospora sp.]
MDAIRHHTFGPPEVLALEQVPDPEPGPGQVLVDAVAHGVHLLDTTLRRGDPGAPLPLPSLPAVPGREVAGTVSAVGPGVDPAWRGRLVAAHLGPVPDGGGYARRVVTGVGTLHALDGDAPLEPATAVALVGTGRTAVYTLEVADITPEDVVVVTAAAGGLGSLIVQEALHVGARVVALSGGPAKLEALRELVDGQGDGRSEGHGDGHGAAGDGSTAAGDRLALVDYTADGWERTARAALGGGRATVVLDGVGGELGTAATALLRPQGTVDGGGEGAVGRLVAYGWASGAPNRYTSWAGDDRIEPGAVEPSIEVRYVVGPDAPPLRDPRAYQERALAHAASGRWRVATHRVPFAEAARAHRELEERRTVGKVVLV